MDSFLLTLDPMATTPPGDIPQLTISPAATSWESDDSRPEDKKADEKKPVKKRKSWGQELPVPKTNLPPRSVLIDW
jgi:transcriptional activator HAC1